MRSARRGSALLLVLGLLLLLATAGLSFTALFLQSFEADRLEAERLPSFYLAEGGLEIARARLARDPSYRGEELDHGAGTVRIEVRGEGASRTVAVRAWATPERRAFGRVEAALRLGDGLPEVVSWAGE